MTTNRPPLPSDTPIIERALQRVVAEIYDGLRHGHFEVTVDCEIVGHERRRLTLHAGKSYQFLIPKDECLHSASPRSCADSRDGSDPNEQP